MDGYHFMHKARSSSFSQNHPLHSQKRGGIGIYYRDSIAIQEIRSFEHLNLEHITFEIVRSNIIVVTCYRSPQQSKTEFLINLSKHLKKIGIEKRIFLIGDLNEDILGDKLNQLKQN